LRKTLASSQVSQQIAKSLEWVRGQGWSRHATSFSSKFIL